MPQGERSTQDIKQLLVRNAIFEAGNRLNLEREFTGLDPERNSFAPGGTTGRDIASRWLAATGEHQKREDDGERQAPPLSRTDSGCCHTPFLRSLSTPVKMPIFVSCKVDTTQRQHHPFPFYLVEIILDTDVDATLDELNYLAAKIDGIGKHDRETFLAALEVERYGGGAAQIINLIENIQHFELQPAFNEEMYGDFLLQDAKDISADAFERLEQSEVAEEKHLAAHILRLETRSIVKEENGVFTKHGYLADRGEFKEIYHGPEDIPREHQLFSRETPEIAKDAAQPDKPAEKESVMDKIREAREAAKNTPAPKPQDRGDHKKSYEPEV